MLAVRHLPYEKNKQLNFDEFTLNGKTQRLTSILLRLKNVKIKKHSITINYCHQFRSSEPFCHF